MGSWRNRKNRKCFEIARILSQSKKSLRQINAETPFKPMNYEEIEPQPIERD
jgi:hypothetical protein